MTNEEEFLKFANYHNISEFANFTIKDIITLQFLVRYSEPIVRHSLYTEVKQFLEFKEETTGHEVSELQEHGKKFFACVNEKKKNLHPPSFYNMLNNLEKKGLVKFIHNGKNKISSIHHTPYTNYLPLLLLKFLINNNVMVSDEFREEFSRKFLEKIKNKRFNKILSIWFSEYVMLPIVKLLSQYSKEQYILSKNDANTVLNGANIKNLKFPEMSPGRIFAPEQIFDAIMIPVYKKDPKFHGMTRLEILEEVSRIIRPDGLVILVAIMRILPTENLFLNDLIKLYNIALNNRIFSVEELRSDMEQGGFSNIEIFEHQGLLIGMGTKA
ncbi:MAG: hypothetical protein ACTSU4_12850 [Promethearchaeota archaeon]